MKKFLIVLVLLGAVFFFTNPKLEDFEGFVQKELTKKLDENGEAETAIGEMLEKSVANAAARLAKNLTERKDYFICSTYTLDLGNETYSYLGLGTIFIPLQAEQPTEWLE